MYINELLAIQNVLQFVLFVLKKEFLINVKNRVYMCYSVFSQSNISNNFINLKELI